MNPPAQSPNTPLAPHRRGWFRTGLQILAGAIVALLLLAFIIPYCGRVFDADESYHMRDAAHLREIGQTALIYAQDHHDQFPEATDVWDYARLLASSGGISDPAFWISRQDPANWDAELVAGILLPAKTAGEPPRVNPTFLRLKPTIAVVLGKMSNDLPATTPLVWTRGLRPDGTWTKGSPYGDYGGFIFFVGGNLMFFRELTSDDGGMLVRFDGKGKTANILESLPPGARIGEYEPTPEEVASWPARPRPAPWTERLLAHQMEIVLFLAFAVFVALCIHVFRSKKRSPGIVAFLIVFGTGLALLMVA